MPAVLTWIICALVVGAMLVRPARVPEWVWAAAGALLLVVLGAVPAGGALTAVRRGTDVYLFLVGMMLLAEIARARGAFDWLAVHALRTARGSQSRLFALVYCVGVAVTALLSNDATAVVLTPAIAAIVERARVPPLPYLFACAFVANAASFVLPISNPANLVVFSDRLPHLAAWLAAFGLPSVVAIAATFLTLRWLSRRSLRRPFDDPDGEWELGRAGVVAVVAVSLAVIGMVGANALGAPLGIATFALGVAALGAVTLADASTPRAVVRSVTWSIVPLVAALFVLVQGLDAAGTLEAARHFFAYASTVVPPLGSVLSAGAVAAVANVANNLTVAAVAALSLPAATSPAVAHAAVVGIDLGPNLAISGSLATLLWMLAVRRAGVKMTPLRFLRVGAIVLLPALVLSALCTR